jgi:monoterpene epsilon-lactone hydrolase
VASPELDVVISLVRSLPLHEGGSVQEWRAALAALAASAPPPEDAVCAPVDAGGVPAEWITASGAAADGALLYLHGGGYCMGSIDTHRPLAARLSAATGLRALVLDYRLAPEHPFPAAVDDATAAYRWLLARGIAPARIVVAGDSAGGGLTVATLVALRDAGDPLPAAGVCLSPWVDLDGEGESMTARAHLDPMVQREHLRVMAAHYLGTAHARTPLAAPLHADLHALPPLLVQVGTRETLLDDATRLAARAEAAGVRVALETWDDMIHVWHAFAPLLPEAGQAIGRIGTWVRARLDGGR